MSDHPPRLLTIAGSDSGGGAGIQADLKTFSALGAYGMSAVTAITAQNTRAVLAVAEVPTEVVARQIDAVFDDIGVDAVKIGMLATSAVIETVADRLAHWSAARGSADRLPIVLDPVMVAKSGDALLADEAIAALVESLLPLATVVTPNLPEAARLTGLAVEEEAERLAAARRLHQLAIGSGAGGDGPAVLIKGGHGEGDKLVDLLWQPPAGTRKEEVSRFGHARIDTTSTHGTGCTLSSAIAARLAISRRQAPDLAEDNRLRSAVDEAIEYLHGAIAAADPIGSGHGPVHHFYRLWKHDV